MKIWITGHKGMLARALSFRINPHHEVVGTGHELDVADDRAVDRFLAQEKPSQIINCAAYTDVDGAETNVGAAMSANAIGPAVLGHAAREHGCDLLHFSTDYVFSGAGTGHWLETDKPVNPYITGIGAYARSKLLGEQALLAQMVSRDARIHIVRTSWLFGMGGKNFVDTMLRLMAEKDELRVVTDQVGRPTYTYDLAGAAASLAGIRYERAPAPSGIYHFANAGAVSWFELAQEIARQAVAYGTLPRAPRIVPVTTQEFPRPAPRPACSVLDTGKISEWLGGSPRPYEEALADYLDERAF